MSADRRRGRWVPALVGVLLLSGPLGAQELPPDYEQGLFEVVVPRVGSAVLVVLVSPTGELLLPVAPVLRLASVPFEIDSARTTMRIPGPAGRDTTLLRLTVPDMTRSGERPVALGTDELRLHAGEPHLSIRRLGEALQGEVVADWERLRIVLSRDSPFPAQRQADLDQQRRLAMLRAQEQSAALPDVPLHSRSGGGVLGVSFSSGALNPFHASFLHTQAGFALAGGRGTVGLRTSRTSEGGASMDQLSGSYERVFPNAPLISRISLGDVVGGGPVARSIRGLAITNAPFTRRPRFDEVLVRPDLPEGWQFEVYQDGRLLGFSDPAGPGGPVAVPLEYGATPVEVRMYGPAGEEVRSELLYQIPATHLPQGRAEYAAGAGACPTDRCAGLAYLAGDFGVRRWLTLGAGGELLRDSAGTSRRLAARGTVAPEGAWTGEFQALFGSYLQAGVRWVGNQRMSGSLSGALRDPGYGQPTFVPGQASRWDLNLNGRIDRYGLGVRVSGLRHGGPDHWHAGLSRPIPRGYVQLSYDGVGGAATPESSDVLSVCSFIALPRAWVSGGIVSAGARVSPERLEGAEGGLSLPLGDAGQIGLTGRWQSGRGADLSLALSRMVAWGRLQGITTTAGDGFRGGYSFDGGIALDPTGPVDPTPAASFGVGFAGVRGRVFYDYDADGRFGEGDEPAAGIQVRAAGRPGRTDRSGRYHIWAVPPYDPISVSIDTVASFLPTWMPGDSRAVLRPVPHVFNEANFPLVRTRELIGELVPEAGVPTAGGVTLEIVQIGSGELREAITFSDGQFYVGRLRAGTYELRVAARSLEALGARAEPAQLRFSVSARGDDPFVEVPAIRLVPAGR